MNTVYIPQRIATAAQAETLPLGTIAFEANNPDLNPTMRIEGGWADHNWQASAPAPHEEMIGATALIPTTAVHELADEWSSKSERGWYASFGDELLEVLAGRPHG